jgi:hypothetical protein
MLAPSPASFHLCEGQRVAEFGGVQLVHVAACIEQLGREYVTALV